MNPIRRKRYSIRNRPLAWFHVAINCSLVAVVALFLLMEGYTLRQNLRFSGQSLYLSEHESSADSDCSDVVIEREISEESESENDGEDESSGFRHEVSAEVTYDLSTGKLLFFQLIQARESRAEISLIILHHCWKSFLH